MIFGTQFCKWIWTILVNLLCCVPCTSLTWWRNVDVTEIMRFTLSPCCRERCQEFIPPEMWPPNSPDLNRVDYSIWGILQERVYRSRIHDVKESKERLLREWYRGCRTTPSSRQRLRNGVVVWMHVFAWMMDILNVNFQLLTFCCVLFVSSILVSVNVIDINICKVLILCEMCYFCVWHFHTVW